MANALRYLSCYSYYFADFPNKERDNFYNTVFAAVAEMAAQKKITAKERTVTGAELIDRLNYIIGNFYLSECFIGFDEKWKEVFSENKMKYPRAYFKSCLLNWLFEYDDSALERW